MLVSTLVITFMLGACSASRDDHFREVAAELSEATEAARQAGVPLHPREIASPKLDPDDNAAPVLKRALQTLKVVKEDVLRMSLSLKKEERNQADELVQKYNPSIDLIFRASGTSGADFGHNYETEKPWDIPFTANGSLRQSAKWLAARALTRTRKGDSAGAIADIRAGFALARFAYAEQTLITMLIGQAIEAITTHQIESIVTERSTDRVLLQGLRQVLEEQPPLPDFWHFLRGEAVFSVCFAKAWPTMGEGELEALFPLDGEAPVLPPGVSRQVAGTALLVRSLQLWTRIADRMQKKDYKISPSEIVTSVLNEKANAKDPTYAFMNVSTDTFEMAGDAYVSRTARIRVVDAVLAVLQYKQRVGKLPSSLSEAGLDSLDPFTGKPLHFRVEGERIVVWSVGPDRIDNGGLKGDWRDIVASSPR